MSLSACRRTGLSWVAFAALLGLAASPLPGQQTGTVRGTVTVGATQRPLAGAQISVGATGLGGVTNGAGQFLILNVPAGTHSVRVQMLGYGNAERTVTVGAGQTASVDVQLEESVIALDAVVVTGTAGAVQKRAVGNVVSQIDAAKLTELAPVGDVSMMLNARAPGVVITPGSGQVGGGTRIRIRGASSFSLNDQPLIYVDGVRVNNAVSSGPSSGWGSSPISRLSDFNPADIESIEVIKGPAAATLYGTEAANGVIQIITKKGRPSDKPRVAVGTRQGVVWFADAENRVPTAYWKDPETGELIEMNLVRLEEERGTPIWKPGRLQGYNLDISGGSDMTRYRMAAAYDADDGIEPTNKLRRFTGNMNLSVSPHSTLDVSSNLNLITSTIDISQENGGASYNTLMGHPRNLDTPRRGFWSVPPEVAWATTRNYQALRRFTGGVQLNHRPIGWFTQRLTLGLDLTSEDNQSIAKRMNEYEAQFYSANAALGSKSVDRRDVTYSTFDYSASLTLPLRAELESQSSVGLQYYRTHTRLAGASGREFPTDGLRTIRAAAVTFGDDDFWENSTVGVFFQQQVSWLNRRFITAAVRADDNSAFGENFTLVYYPKLSGSWVLSEEPFWNVPFLEAFRLRAAYGASGQQPETFAALRTYDAVTGGNGSSAVTPYFIGNPDLAPERGEEMEVGFEAALLGQRLSLDFTYYNQRTRDAILLREQPPSLGFPGAQFVNAGEIHNHGMEMRLSALVMDARAANWDMTFNLSTNSNQVVSLGGDEFVPLGDQQHRVGYPIAAWFQRLPVSAELDADGKAINVLCDGGPENQHRAVPCDEAPRVYLGRSTPGIEGAYSNTVTLFDRLTLYGLVDFKLGHKKDNRTDNNRCTNRRICPENIWPERYPAVLQAEFQDPELFETNLRIRDASFAKLREVAVSYAMPDRWVQSFGASQGTIRVGARNLYTWTRWTGLDPEGDRTVQQHLRQEHDALPQLTQLVTTINLTF